MSTPRVPNTSSSNTTAAAAEPPCQLRYFTPAEAAALLRGRRLAFAGDSLMRQFFLRLLQFLRGFPLAADRVFHPDAFYSRNVSADRLSVELLPGQPLDPKPVEAASIVAAFEWAPDYKGSDGQVTVPAERVLQWQPDVAVIGTIYWHEPEISAADKAAAKRVVDGCARTFWVGTPIPNWAPGGVVLKHLEARAPERNADMRAFCAENGITFLPLDLIEEGSRGEGEAVRPAGLHFMVRSALSLLMCIFSLHGLSSLFSARERACAVVWFGGGCLRS